MKKLTISKSKVMKRAWAIKKENSKNIFALCLKMAWQQAHEALNKRIEEDAAKKVVVKSWFIDKTLGLTVDAKHRTGRIVKETEKALFVVIKGMENIWVPKSCIEKYL